MANSITSLHNDYWSSRVKERLMHGGTVIGIPYRERGDDAYIEMKRRLYAEEDRIFARRQRILAFLMLACLVALFIV